MKSYTTSFCSASTTRYALGLLAWSACFLLIFTARQLSAADFYVGPAGSDANPGTRAKPFATLERARDQVRAQAQLSHKRITIWVASGDYFRTNAFQLSVLDSGTAEAPVTWRALKPAAARFLGGVRVAGFRPVSDAASRARLSETARSHVVQADLRALGITDFGEMSSRGFSRPTTPAHCELFFRHQPMTLARWPNEGAFERIAGVPTTQLDEHGGKMGKLEDGFLYAGDRPRGWKDTSDIWVHGYWSWDWANSYERVASINLEQKLIKTAPPLGLYGFRKGQRFYFLNVLEELDEPGEWFLDRSSGQLYFWPPQPIEPSDEVLLSTLAQPLIKMTDASYITIRDFTLEAVRGSAVEIHGGARDRIESCLIRNIGDNGVAVDGGADHGVANCDVFDTGDGGVSLSGGDRQTLKPAGHFVENCHFARQGRWSKCYVPAVSMSGVGMRVSHNLIHDHPHCAILFTGNDHLIEFNEIHHIALETGDVGAIYTGRDYTYRGNRVRYNFIHHTGGVGMGSMGIYNDDCVSGTEMFGNIFYKVQRAAFLGGGRDLQVVNNVFVECNNAVELDGRGVDPSPVWHDMVDKTMRERLKEVPLALYRERYPAMKALDAYYGPPGGPAIAGADFKGVPPENNLVARNVCVGKWLNVYWHAKSEVLRLENNFTNSTPGFVGVICDDSRPTDFALRRDSSAWKLGFQKIPVKQIGLQRSK